MFRKIRFAAAVSALGLVIAAGAAHAGSFASSGYVEQTQTASNTGASAYATTKIYWKHESVRLEDYTVDGVMITIKNGSAIYKYSPAQKVAIRGSLGAKAPKVEQMLMASMKLFKMGSKIGSATVAGVRCDERSATIPGASSGYKATVWVSTDPRFPLPLRSDIRMGTASQSTIVRSLKLGTSVSDSMFTLPKGTKIVDQSKSGPRKVSPGHRGSQKK